MIDPQECGRLAGCSPVTDTEVYTQTHDPKGISEQ